MVMKTADRRQTPGVCVVAVMLLTGGQDSEMVQSGLLKIFLTKIHNKNII